MKYNQKFAFYKEKIYCQTTFYGFHSLNETLFFSIIILGQHHPDIFYFMHRPKNKFKTNEFRNLKKTKQAHKQ